MITKTNMMKLALEKMALDAVPKGGGLADGVKFLMDAPRMLAAAREAQLWAKQAVEAVRNASGNNPYRDADDETIAGEILKQVEARRKRKEL